MHPQTSEPTESETARAFKGAFLSEDTAPALQQSIECFQQLHVRALVQIVRNRSTCFCRKALLTGFSRPCSTTKTRGNRYLHQSRHDVFQGADRHPQGYSRLTSSERRRNIQRGDTWK